MAKGDVIQDRDLIERIDIALANKDTTTGEYGSYNTSFLLTRPMRGVTGCRCSRIDNVKFLLTRPMRGVTGRYVLQKVVF